MIIIKKGKSNWRYIWIVVISAVTLGGGALIYQYLNTEGLEEISIYHFFVKEKPERGEANRAVINILTQYFHVLPNKIRLIKGFKQRNKIFKIV